MSYPSSFNVYKKSAAAQFTLLPPRRDDNGRVQKAGAVLLEVAPSQGEKSYDWKNSKLTFAFGINDMTQFFDDPNSSKWGSFFHQNDGSNKKLVFTEGKDRYQGTYMMTLMAGDAKVSVPLSAGEFHVISRLFACAIPKMLGWE
jgi:hypothetical protein